MPFGFSRRSALRHCNHKSRRAVAKRRRLFFDSLEDRRMLSAGDLDPSFGTGGIVETPPVAAGATDWGGVARLGSAVDSAGRLVVVGQINGYDIGVERFNANGSLDTTFGKGGIVETSLGPANQPYYAYQSAAYAVAIDPASGKILVLGNTVLHYSNKPLVPTNNNAFVLLRYNTNGTLDTTFGDAKTGGGHLGYVTTLVPGNSYMDEPQTLAIDSQSRIVASGFVGVSGQGAHALLRYTSSGKLDTTFGSNGTLLFGNIATSSDMKLQPDDKIVVGTFGYGAFDLYRFTTSGTPDSTFGTNGLVTTALAGGVMNSALIQSDGDILAVGHSNQATPGGQASYVSLARYTPAGQLDSSFGSGGIAYGPELENNLAMTASLDEAGRAVVATSQSIMRFTTAGALDTSFEPAGNGVAPAAPGVLPSELLLAPNDALYEAGGSGIARYFGDSAPVTTLPAAQFGVFAPANDTAGVPFNVTVTAEDASGSTVSSFNGAVALTDGNGSALGGVTLTNGVGTISLTLNTTGSYTLTASGADSSTGTPLTGTDTIDVYAPATQLVLSGIPAGATAGTPFTAMVTAYAADGSVAGAYSGALRLTVSNDWQAVLPTSLTLSGGVATFTATLKTAGNQTITATDSSDNSLTATSGPIVVSAAAASQLSLSAPSSVTSGTPFMLTVTALDAYGNVVTDYGGKVQITSGGRTLASGTLTNGVGTFTLTLTNTARRHQPQQQTITVTDGSITSSIVVTVD